MEENIFAGLEVIPQKFPHTVELGYNDIALYDTSSVASDIVSPVNSSLLTITLHSLVRTTLFYSDIKYSPFQDVITRSDCISNSQATKSQKAHFHRKS